MAGVGTNNLPVATIIDDLLGNAGGNTRRIPIDRLVALIAALMGPSYSTRAQLYGDLGWPAGAIGYVRADGTAAFNGVYKKSGGNGGGSWSRIGDLPTGAIEASQLAELTAELRTRRVASTANSDFSGTTFPTGTGTVIFRSSTNVAIWQALTIPPDPVTASHQQDATGAWWGRAFQLSDVRNVLQNAGVFNLRNIGGTANAITAELPVAAINAGIVIDTETTIEVVPVLANTTAGPTLRIGTDIARTIKTELGAAAPANFLRPGVPMQFRRVNADWRAFASVTSDQLNGARNEAATATALEASARADADGFQRAALRQGAITLVNVSLTGNAYTADIEAIFASVAMTDIPLNGEVSVSFPATNPGQNPTVNGRGLRRRNGNPWPAGKIIPGSPYTLKRIGNELRVLSGDVQGEELEGGLASVSRKLVTITSASTSGERNSTSWTQVPGSYSFADIAVGNAPAALTSPHTGDVQVEQVVDGLRHVWLDASGRRFERLRKAGVWGTWLEIARESRVAALEATVNLKANQSDLAAEAVKVSDLQAQALLGGGVLNQVGPDLPVRPPFISMSVPLYWRCWDSPQAFMGKNDTWVQMPVPDAPDVPLSASWDVYDARNGQSLAVIIRSVPDETPPITGIDRRVGGEEGPWIGLPAAAPGTYLIDGLAPGLDTATIRHRNFVDAGDGDIDRGVAVTASDITADLSGTGLLMKVRPSKWQSLTGLNIDTKGFRLVGGEVDLSHNNEAVRALYRDYFTTGQFIRARIQSLDAVAHPAQLDGIALGINCNGVNGIRAHFRRSGVTLHYIENNGVTRRTLASFSQSWGFPIDAEIRRAGGGSIVEVLVGGTVVISFDLTGDAAANLTGGAPELFAFVSNGGTPAATRMAIIQMGHA
ncbi:hypothetical protein [Paracoccus sp. ME4]|uniref:hypothetical protein n=1 Tax=Paracoccus sp. ME4 TaxID=3138066 RepID=UPI00398A77EB